MLEYLNLLHPKLVHFPIALFLTALGFETLSLILKKETFHQCAVILYVTAALLTPLVVRTGIFEAERIALHHPVLDEHREYGLWTMWVSLASLPVLWFFTRKYTKFFKPVFWLFLVAAAVLVILTGHEGGEMVFEYGVGTELF